MNFKLILEFLIDLRFNNNRAWFKENNASYRRAKSEFEGLIESLLPGLKQIDESIDVSSPKDYIFRIFRDVRFSGNKEPYKTNFGAFISKEGRKGPYAGYYIHIEPDRSFIGGGIYMPEPHILKAIRAEIYENIDEFKEIINKEKFREVFPEIFGERLKLPPKGFPKDFEDIDLLKHKHYAVAYNVDNSFWMADDKLVQNLLDIFKIQYPFNTFLNRAVEKSIDH